MVQPPIVTPNLPSASQPNLGPVAGFLGNWLGRNRPSSVGWLSPRSIPGTWPSKHENAIVYEIDAGEGGITYLTGHFAVNNGIWVRVNGAFKFGAIQPGTNVSVFKYANIRLGDLPPGKS